MEHSIDKGNNLNLFQSACIQSLSGLSWVGLAWPGLIAAGVSSLAVYSEIAAEVGVFV